MFIDSHCHLDAYEEFSGESLENLFARLQAASLNAASIPDLSGERTWSSSKKNDPDPNIRMPEAFIHVACSPENFDDAIKLSERFPFVFTAFGLHPETVDRETHEDEARLVKLLQHPKCVGCGEFGLDYHYGADFKEQQIKLFERHLEIGMNSEKPLVLHLREADDDAIAILKNANLGNKKIHVHCFTGNANFVDQLLKLNDNVFVGFTGIVTFKSAENVREAAAAVPLERLLLETDSPYMAPVPHRGKTCHSGYIPYIAQMLAEVKEVSVELIYSKCRENTRNIYGI